MDHIVRQILLHLDVDTLKAAELVCKDWLRVISFEMLWKRLIERKVQSDPLWYKLSQRRKWIQYLFQPQPGTSHPPASFYRSLYPKVLNDLQSIENNWQNSHYDLKRIRCKSKGAKGAYCLQYDDRKIVAGLRDNSIKIWDRESLKCINVLRGHSASVLCLQFNDDVIISGSNDTTIRIWDIHTGDLLNTCIHHAEAVTCLKFDSQLLVSCSKVRSNLVKPRVGRYFYIFLHFRRTMKSNG